MKVIEKIEKAREEGRVVYSMEFVSPLGEVRVKNLFEALDRIVQTHNPAFCDITWPRASLSHQTLDIANKMQNSLCFETMIHLSCAEMPVEKIDHVLDTIKSNGIQNVLAVRGYTPKGKDEFVPVEGGFAFASDLVKHIRTKYGDYFGITVAGYPEGNPATIRSNGAATLEGYQNDLVYLKRKVDAGADLIITQEFYDSDIFLKFVDDCRQIGITCPIVPGITPIANYKSFLHLTANACNPSVPSEIMAALEPIKDNKMAVALYGIHHGTEMCKKLLAHGIKAFHFNTWNKEFSTIRILQNLMLTDGSNISRPLLPKRECVVELPTSRLPWLMLFDNPPKSSNTHVFFSVVDNSTYELKLLEALGKRCVGSSKGWLITIDSNLEIRLLNPFTRALIQLPPLPNFQYQSRGKWKATSEYLMNIYMHKAFLSSSPLADDCLVLAIHNELGNLAFSRPGSAAWTTIETYDLSPFHDAIFYQGRFYAVSGHGTLVVCDLGPVPRVKEILPGPKSLQRQKKYLVATSDKLLLLGRYRSVEKQSYRTLRFKAYVLKAHSGEGGQPQLHWKKVESLHGKVLFVGTNSSVCFSAKNIPRCKRNCIYFTDDYRDAVCVKEDRLGSDVGVFNYRDGTIKPLYPDVYRSRLWPPVWVS